jgi:hypothetical protein
MIDMTAGPWIGEFGWELFGWQGYLRAIAKEYNYVVVSGPPGHEYLYSDFASEYRPYIHDGDEPNMWMNNGRKVEAISHDKECMYLPPQQLTLMPNAPEQAFIKFGKKSDDGPTLVYHARALEKYGSGYMTWGDQNWEEFLGGYDNMVCIGSPDGAKYYGGKDMRGAPLGEICDVLASAEVLVGPSSGPIHLGSLCGTPHVVWSGHYINKGRYEDWWNPLKTPVRTIMPKSSPWTNKRFWQPRPIDVRAQVEALRCAA